MKAKQLQHDGIILDGSLFIADRERETLIRSMDSNTVIPFDAIQIENGVASLTLNSVKKELVDKESQLLLVRFPAEFLSKSFRPDADDFNALNALSYKENRNALLVDDAIVRRLEGTLPRVNIEGNVYQVDWENRRLSGEGLADISIKSRLSESPLELAKSAFHYDLATRQTVMPDFRASVMPDNIILVFLPDIRWIDPIGYARSTGLEDTALLPRYPMRGDTTMLKSVALAQTSFADVVEANRKKEIEAAKKQVIRRSRKR
ncbi:hypothetical protein MKQ68_18905 [Chitinophaga horti]|uniref:Uncharacterized protein n=1 Tax=Chitinophaga horti TaxID=2920382 RepID=A0ABY6IXP5_9BACT|nr:hypothetical protein [Chitinophaga horti]UYQ92160.1 hypothetical protein MKQ68_18905 [Chitinophaga horti]